MCGIVGFIGNEQAAPILLDGLAHLEYRGYDSAGVAVISSEQKLQVRKAVGRLKVLSDEIHGGADIEGCIGLGHTRWATHGAPNIANSHPHVSENGKFAVIHNGIIENYVEIKEFLIGQGITFKSETDTEVVAQLLEFYYNECHDFLEAVGRVLRRIDPMDSAVLTVGTMSGGDAVNITAGEARMVMGTPCSSEPPMKITSSFFSRR